MADKEGKQIAAAPRSFGDASDFVEQTPGKETLVENEWAQNGAKCDGHDASTMGCFLDDAVRLRYLIDFKDDVRTAATNYKLALVELRVEELMKKDDDLNWVLSLALEIAGGHLIEMAGKALLALKVSGAAKFAGAAMRSKNMGGWNANASRALGGISKKSLETLAKTPMNGVKTRLSKGMEKKQNSEAKQDKNVVVAYIDQLKNQCDVAFKAFASIASATASDAELVVLFEGMNPENHTIEIYKTLLGEKLDRFRKSAVPEIGRKAGYDRETGYAAVYRDTRVVWVRDFLGNRRLYFQSQEGNADPSIRRPGEPGLEQVFPLQVFGPHDPREAPVLGEPVPDEFRDVAIARSQQQWGLIQEIEDPYTTYMRWRGIDPSKQSATATPKSAAKAGAGASAGNPGPGSRNEGPGAPSVAKTPLSPATNVPAQGSKIGSDPLADLDAAGM